MNQDALIAAHSRASTKKRSYETFAADNTTLQDFQKLQEIENERQALIASIARGFSRSTLDNLLVEAALNDPSVMEATLAIHSRKHVKNLNPKPHEPLPAPAGDVVEAQMIPASEVLPSSSKPRIRIRLNTTNSHSKEHEPALHRTSESAIPVSDPPDSYKRYIPGGPGGGGRFVEKRIGDSGGLNVATGRTGGEYQPRREEVSIVSTERPKANLRAKVGRCIPCIAHHLKCDKRQPCDNCVEVGKRCSRRSESTSKPTSKSKAKNTDSNTGLYYSSTVEFPNLITDVREPQSSSDQNRSSETVQVKPTNTMPERKHPDGRSQEKANSPRVNLAIQTDQHPILPPGITSNIRHHPSQVNGNTSAVQKTSNQAATANSVDGIKFSSVKATEVVARSEAVSPNSNSSNVINWNPWDAILGRKHGENKETANQSVVIQAREEEDHIGDKKREVLGIEGNNEEEKEVNEEEEEVDEEGDSPETERESEALPDASPESATKAEEDEKLRNQWREIGQAEHKPPIQVKTPPNSSPPSLMKSSNLMVVIYH